jgi:hypothetical protein
MKHPYKLLSIRIIVVFVLLAGYSCDENEVEYDTIYSELYEIKLEGQIGNAVIDYENKTISATIYAENYAAIEILELAVSKNATTSISIGETIDFSTSDSHDLTITAETGGSTKIYTINIEKFTAPPFVGDWTVSSEYADQIRLHLMWVTSWWEGDYVGAWNLVDSWWNPWWQGEFWSCEWGGDYCYDMFTNGAAVMDNTLSMGEVQGVTEDLKMYGDFIYGPGADGNMGSYEHTNASTWEVNDFNDSFSVLPTSGTWELDLNTNRLEFFNSDKSKSVKTFIAGLSPGEFSNKVANGEEIKGNGFNGSEYGWEMIDGKFQFFLEVDRTNLKDQWDAFYAYGVDWYGTLDATQAKIHGGFALEFRMVKSN